MAVKKGIYECSVCGFKTPQNTISLDRNGVEVSRCPIHQARREDEILMLRVQKQKEKSDDELRQMIAGSKQ